MTNKNIVITGYARHGKDTVCDLLTRYGYTFESSSMVACAEVVFPMLAMKYGYRTPEECYLDRVNHRSEWFDLIVRYNTPDLTTLGRKIFSTSNIYCGLRNINELKALQEANLVDAVIWVDASERRKPEDSSSISIRPEDADMIIDNNQTIETLQINVNFLAGMLKYISFTGVVKPTIRSSYVW